MTALLDVSGVSKDYRGLRPLRLHRLTVASGERIALLGLDQVSAEVLVNLITGATLPDAGQVSAFGRATSDIADSDEWLRLVDRFGIVSERAVLLESMTALQNLALPFTLAVDPLGGETLVRAEDLARQVELPPTSWNARAGSLGPDEQMRIRVGRALALQPEMLLVEHATVRLDVPAAASLAQTIKDAASRRGIALVAMTADERFAQAVAERVLRWEAATGRLTERRGFFRRHLG